jgi:hypothetical protein
MARADYRDLVEHYGLELPRREDGTSPMLAVAMMELTEPADLELRKHEKKRRRKK